MKRFFGIIFIFLYAISYGDELETCKDTLSYGTYNAILNCINLMIKKKDFSLSNEVLNLYDNVNDKVKTSLIDYFMAKEDIALSDRMNEIVKEYQKYSQELLIKSLYYILKTEKQSPPEIEEALKEISRNDLLDTSLKAIEILGFSSENEEFLFGIYENEISTIKQAKALEMLGTLKSTKVLEIAMKVIKDETADENIRYASINVLKEIGGQDSLKTLLEVFDSSKNAYFRNSLIQAIGNFDGDEVIKAILKALRDDFYLVRQSSLEQIEKKGLVATGDAVIYIAKNDSESSVRRSAAKAALALKRDADLSKFLQDPKVFFAQKQDAIDVVLEEVQKYSVILNEFIASENIKKQKISAPLRYISAQLSKQIKEGLEVLYASLLESSDEDVVSNAIGGIILNKIASLKQNISGLSAIFSGSFKVQSAIKRAEKEL